MRMAGQAMGPQKKERENEEGDLCLSIHRGQDESGMKAEYKIFIVAFVFIVIADSIGQIQVPLGPGTLILFPIFYSLIMGVLAGPEVLKIFNRKEVKAAAELPAGICVAFGLVTGALCALSGAGGPILVMPLLVVFGVPVKTAVGVALFNSIFIAIPSCIGYSLQCDPAEMAVLLAVSMISHGIGVWAGSRNTSFLKPKALKKGVAVFSVLLAVFKLITG